MASRLMSAYGNLASARTNIGRSLSNITGIGIEMEYGPEGRISGEMAQSRIQRQTEAIGLGLESVQQIAGMGLSASKEAARAKEMGTLAGTGAKQTVGETKLWDLFRKGKADIDIAGGETWWGEVGERIGTGLGFTEREYDIGGRAYTSSQIEAAVPYARLGQSWEDVSKLMGGGKEVYDPRNYERERPYKETIDPDELAAREGYGAERTRTSKKLDKRVTPYKPQEGMFEGSRRYDKSGKIDPIAEYSAMSKEDIWSLYQKGQIDDKTFDLLLATGKYKTMGTSQDWRETEKQLYQ